MINTTVKDVIAHLEQYTDKDAPMAYDLWGAEDVEQQASEDGYEPLTPSEIADVLGFVQRHKDATIGLNWGMISCALDEVVPDKKRAKEAA